jgi:hypothetical protein
MIHFPQRTRRCTIAGLITPEEHGRNGGGHLVEACGGGHLRQPNVVNRQRVGKLGPTCAYGRLAGGASWNRTSDLSIIREADRISLRPDVSRRVPISLSIGAVQLCRETQRDVAGLIGTNCWDKVGTDFGRGTVL